MRPPVRIEKAAFNPSPTDQAVLGGNPHVVEDERGCITRSKAEFVFPLFLAIYDVFVTLEACLRGHLRRVRASLRFREGEGTDGTPGRHLWVPRLALLVSPELVDTGGRQCMNGEGGRHREMAVGQFLVDDGFRGFVSTEAAVLLAPSARSGPVARGRPRPLRGTPGSRRPRRRQGASLRP